MTNAPLLAAFAVMTIMLGATDGASAASRSHHRRPVAPARATDPAPRVDREARAPSSFYPFEIEGGVSGNLPFNNQIRKMKDPLNANGAGR